MTKTTNRNTARSPSIRRLIVAGAVALLVVGVLVGTWWAVGGTNAFAPRKVADMLASSSELHPVEATSQLCGDPACVEGWSTDLGSYLRFNSTGEAEYWATVLGDDGRRFEKVVLDMRGKNLTFDERRKAIDVLFSAHDWY